MRSFHSALGGFACALVLLAMPTTTGQVPHPRPPRVAPPTPGMRSPDPLGFGVPTIENVTVRSVRAYPGNFPGVGLVVEPEAAPEAPYDTPRLRPLPPNVPIYLGNGTDKAVTSGAVIDWVVARRDVKARFEWRQYVDGRYSWECVRFLGTLPPPPAEDK